MAGSTELRYREDEIITIPPAHNFFVRSTIVDQYARIGSNWLDASDVFQFWFKDNSQPYIDVNFYYDVNNYICTYQAAEYFYVESFPGYSLLPSDPDGDGLYEDINGNGRMDFDDVVAYFNNMDWIRENPRVGIRPYDYNGNGRIDFDDPVCLYWEVLGTDSYLRTIDVLDHESGVMMVSNLSFVPAVKYGDIGGIEAFDLVVDRLPRGLSGYEINVTLNDPDVADIVGVSYPSWVIVSSNSTLPADKVSVSAVDLLQEVDANDTNVILATIFVRSDQKRAVEIGIDMIEFDGDDGGLLDIAIDPGLLDMIRVIT